MTIKTSQVRQKKSLKFNKGINAPNLNGNTKIFTILTRTAGLYAFAVNLTFTATLIIPSEAGNS